MTAKSAVDEKFWPQLQPYLGPWLLNRGGSLGIKL